MSWIDRRTPLTSFREGQCPGLLFPCRNLWLGQQGTGRMAASEVATGIIFLSQTVVGILSNSSLLLHFLILDSTRCRVRHTDLLIQHLFVANLLTLLCRGIPHTVAAFGMKYFLSAIGCKLLFTLHRIGRGVSICSICLLSIFQAIKISSGNSRWAELKVKAPRYIIPSIYLGWILSFLLSIINFMYLTAKSKNATASNLKDYGYCSSVRHDPSTDSLFAAVLTFPDVVGVGLMLWASSSMVLTLYRHKQKMQRVHKASSPRSSAESRATKTILLLVSAFVSFYTLSCFFQLSLAVVYNPHWFLVNTTAIVTGFFPAISPFLFMSRDSNVCRLFFAWISNRKTPNVIRDV
uniref:Vomeronasal type-1 receptor n=1 Tax=Sciurus vulgaris TaxID=55149 RepID=A0A8D2DLF4_SCIVU